VRQSTYCDANLMHDLVTGRSCGGALDMLNQTPIDWFSKRQSQVETATYGSEFMVARNATERITDLRYTLRSFGVPLDGPSWLFGDNKSVVTSSTIPHSTLGKRWNALSYHRVREAVAGGWIRFEHISGLENPADILTKPLPWFKMKLFVEPLLLWKGNPLDAPSVTQFTEGSDAGPSPGVADGVALVAESRIDENRWARSETVAAPGAHTMSIPIELRNNHYGVLYGSTMNT